VAVGDVVAAADSDHLHQHILHADAHPEGLVLRGRVAVAQIDRSFERMGIPDRGEERTADTEFGGQVVIRIVEREAEVGDFRTRTHPGAFEHPVKRNPRVCRDIEPEGVVREQFSVRGADVAGRHRQTQIAADPIAVGQIRRNAERPERFDADDWVIILVFGNERVVLVVRTELRLPVKTGAERDRMFVVEGVESAEGHQVVALFHVAHPGRVGESHLEQVVAEERRGRVLEYGVSSAGSRYRSVGHTRCADIGVDRQELLSRCRRCARQEDYCENEDLFHNL
jgi:hypothetical protein